MRDTFLVFMKKTDSCCCWRTCSPLLIWNHRLPPSWFGTLNPSGHLDAQTNHIYTLPLPCSWQAASALPVHVCPSLILPEHMSKKLGYQNSWRRTRQHSCSVCQASPGASNYASLCYPSWVHLARYAGSALQAQLCPGPRINPDWKNSSCCCPTVLTCSCHFSYLLVVPNLVTHSDKWIVWHISLSLSFCLGYFPGTEALRGWGHSLLKCPTLASGSLGVCVLPLPCKKTFLGWLSASWDS